MCNFCEYLKIIYTIEGCGASEHDILPITISVCVYINIYMIYMILYFYIVPLSQNKVVIVNQSTITAIL